MVLYTYANSQKRKYLENEATTDQKVSPYFHIRLAACRSSAPIISI